MKPFEFIDSINIDTIANKFSLYNDWHNPYSMMRQASYFVHQDTDTIPLMWSLESLKNSPAHEQAPKTEYWEKYFDVVKNSLLNSGKAALQIITIDKKRSFDYQNQPDFIQQYICLLYTSDAADE